jgi:hypothetical protein
MSFHDSSSSSINAYMCRFSPSSKQSLNLARIKYRYPPDASDLEIRVVHYFEENDIFMIDVKTAIQQQG